MRALAEPLDKARGPRVGFCIACLRQNPRYSFGVHINIIFDERLYLSTNSIL
jgi:hypothetical protein